MSTSKESVLIKGGVLLFAAGFSSGRLLLGVVNGNRTSLVYTLIAILLVPVLVVDGFCLTQVVHAFKERITSAEKRQSTLAPALYVAVSILGLLTGYITFGAV